MPTLRQLNCVLEKGNSRVPFPEYATSYGDGVVETYIAVPDHPQHFALHLTSKGYIAEGLAMIVFMDGDYQCNRNRTGLRPFRPGADQSKTEVAFRVRQKEKSTGDGKFLGKSWRFDKHNIVPMDQLPSNLNRDHLQDIGKISVFVLRFRPQDEMDVMSTMSSNVDDSHGVDGTPLPALAGDSDSESATDEENEKPGSSGPKFASTYPSGAWNKRGHHFGLDGAGPDPVGDVPGMWNQTYQYPPGPAPHHPGNQSHSQSQAEPNRARPQRRVHFNDQMPSAPSNNGGRNHRQRGQGGSQNSFDPHQHGHSQLPPDHGPPQHGGYPSQTPLQPGSPNYRHRLHGGSESFYHHPANPSNPEHHGPQHAYPAAVPPNHGYAGYGPPGADYWSPTPAYPPYGQPPWAGPSVLSPTYMGAHPPMPSMPPFQPPYHNPYYPPQYPSGSYGTMPVPIPNHPGGGVWGPPPQQKPSVDPAKDDTSPEGEAWQNQGDNNNGNETSDQDQGNGSSWQHNDQTNTNNDAGSNNNDQAHDQNNSNSPQDDRQNRQDDDNENTPAASSWGDTTAVSGNWDNTTPADNTWNSTDPADNTLNSSTPADNNWNNSTTAADSWDNTTAKSEPAKAEGESSTATQQWNNAGSDSNNNFNSDNQAWPASTTQVTQHHNNPSEFTAGSRPLYGPHGPYYQYTDRDGHLMSDARPAANEDPPYDVPADMSTTHQVKAGQGWDWVHRKKSPEYIDSLEEPYARFIFRYRTKSQIEQETGLIVNESGAENDKINRLQEMSKDELIEMIKSAKLANGGQNHSSTPRSVPAPEQGFLAYNHPPAGQNTNNAQPPSANVSSPPAVSSPSGNNNWGSSPGQNNNTGPAASTDWQNAATANSPQPPQNNWNSNSGNPSWQQQPANSPQPNGNNNSDMPSWQQQPANSPQNNGNNNSADPSWQTQAAPPPIAKLQIDSNVQTYGGSSSKKQNSGTGDGGNWGGGGATGTSTPAMNANTAAIGDSAAQPDGGW